MTKIISYNLLMLMLLMLFSSLADFHVDHNVSDINSCHTGESHAESAGSCSGETIFDHLFECVGGVIRNELSDNTYSADYSLPESAAVSPDCVPVNHPHISKFKTEYNQPLHNSKIPLTLSDRAPPLFI